MPVRPPVHASPTEALEVAERLRGLLSRWVRTTREQAATPSSAEMETLRLLQDLGPLTIAALAQLRAVKHQSMRLVIERLVLEQTVLKRVDPNDGRSQLVSITMKGRSAIRRGQAVRTRWIAKVLQDRDARGFAEIEAAIAVLEEVLCSVPAKLS